MPAPLLPRKPKISPRAHVERHVVDGDELAEAAGQVLDRRWRWQPSVSGHHWPTRPLEAALGEPRVGERARAIELGLQQRDLRVEHVGAGRDAGAKRSPTTRRASVAARTPSAAATIAARLESSSSRRWRTSKATWRSKSATRARRRGPSRRPRPGPPGCGRRPRASRSTLTDASHESSHCVGAREDARVRARVVVAAGDRDLRQRLGRSQRRCARARLPARSSSARRSGRWPCACATSASAVADRCRRSARSRAAAGSMRAGGVGADQALQVRFAIAALVGCFDGKQPLRATAAPRRTDVVRRDETLLEADAQIADVRVDALERSR